jgi:hypothetical protein
LRRKPGFSKPGICRIRARVRRASKKSVCTVPMKFPRMTPLPGAAGRLARAVRLGVGKDRPAIERAWAAKPRCRTRAISRVLMRPRSRRGAPPLGRSGSFESLQTRAKQQRSRVCGREECAREAHSNAWGVWGVCEGCSKGCSKIVEYRFEYRFEGVFELH